MEDREWKLEDRKLQKARPGRAPSPILARRSSPSLRPVLSVPSVVPSPSRRVPGEPRPATPVRPRAAPEPCRAAAERRCETVQNRRGRTEHWRATAKHRRGANEHWRGPTEKWRGPLKHRLGTAEHWHGATKHWRGAPKHWRGTVEECRRTTDDGRGTALCRQRGPKGGHVAAVSSAPTARASRGARLSAPRIAMIVRRRRGRGRGARGESSCGTNVRGPTLETVAEPLRAVAAPGW